MVLTKLDSAAKGGIVVAPLDLGIPVKFVGLGEGPYDLASLDPEPFIDALLADV